MLSILQAGVSYFRHRFPREDGAVATEYGLLLVLIALVIIGAVIFLGDVLFGIFDDAGNELSGA
jgi:pilus assembly protein Flp/PilA